MLIVWQKLHRHQQEARSQEKFGGIDHYWKNVYYAVYHVYVPFYIKELFHLAMDNFAQIRQLFLIPLISVIALHTSILNKCSSLVLIEISIFYL